MDYEFEWLLQSIHSVSGTSETTEKRRLIQLEEAAGREINLFNDS